MHTEEERSYTFWDAFSKNRNAAWERLAGKAHPKDVMCVDIRNDTNEHVATLESENSVLVIAEIVGIIESVAFLKYFGMTLDCLWEDRGHLKFPRVGTQLTITPQICHANTMGVVFMERAISKLRTPEDKVYHRDITALLEACTHERKIVLTVLRNI